MWIFIVITFISIVYITVIRPHTYWTLRGVKQCNPLQMIVNNMGTLLKKHAFAEMIQIVYHSAPNAKRYVGMYQFNLPSLVLKDPDLIKQITVKDFDHFVDHRSFVPENTEPILRNNVFSLTGHRWRQMRATLSPAFTSSKMKYMFKLISHNGEQFVNHFLQLNQDLITMEMKSTLTRFTSDVIANTAFGIECDSLKDRENEFYTMGIEATTFTGVWQTFKFLGYFIYPKLFKLFRIRMITRKASSYFVNLVKQNIKSPIVRPNMIHLLLQARKHGLKNDDNIVDTGFATAKDSSYLLKPRNDIKITEEDVASQALIFFFAGFDTVCMLMCFMAYELAVNPDIQKKLIEEIDETGAICNEKITYEALLNMKYLDMIVSESLRKWPNGVVTDRVCTKPYTIQPKYADERPIHLAVDDLLWVPIYAIHRDPDYYPEPEKFLPERFSDENKINIKPYTYLPFGAGPRNCIGSRFAILETKALFFHLLTHFTIEPIEKTQIPLKLSKKGFIINAETGFWLGLQRRNINQYK